MHTHHPTPIAPPSAEPASATMLAGPCPRGQLARARASARRRTHRLRRLASDAGQGTVEYVGLLLLMATVLAAVVGAAKGLGGEDAIGKKVVTQVGKSIDEVGGARPSR